MFVPKNEMGVFYLFSKIHKKLGFEEIVSFQKFPDIMAKRNGKIVQIELEYKLSGFRHHFYDFVPNGPYAQDSPYGTYSKGKRDFKDEKVDYVICWRKDMEIQYPVKIIELQNEIANNKKADKA